MTHADYMALLHAAQRAIYARQRLTGARLNLSYTTPADIVADAWIIGATTCRPALDAIPEATRRAYRAQQRHSHFCIDDCLHTPELSTAGQDITDEISPHDLPPTLARLSEGYTLAEIAAHTGRSVSAVWKQKNIELQKLRRLYSHV